jgi:thiamine pyrophosphate-dependent enzyme
MAIVRLSAFSLSQLYDPHQNHLDQYDPHRGTPMTKGSDLLLARLEREDVEENVVESLRGSKREPIVTRYEWPTGFVAETYGRLTGKPGICISAPGPGTLNFCFISKVL